jgi:MFS family permease
VGTLIQLYIIELHGTVIDVGLAITLFNAVGIPASIFWGFATDRLESRRSLIAVSSAAISVNLIFLLFAPSIYGASFVYAVFSFVSSASATPANLLIMETQRKPLWATAFARLSMVSSIGTTLGLVLGVAWSSYLSLQLLVVPLAFCSLLSAVLSFVMIRQPPFIFEEEIIVMERPSLQSRLLALPLVFLRVPGLVDFKAVFKGLRNTLTRQLPLLYLSTFVFYVSSGLFNTSLVPSLGAAGLTGSQIFIASTMATVVEAASFYYAGPYIVRRDLRKSSVTGLILRSACFATIGLFAATTTGLTYLGAIFVLYPLAAGLAFALYYTSSNIMLFNTLGPRNQGARLGVYSALVGIGATLGSFVSGYLSFNLGFPVTCVFAAIGLGVCALLTPNFE